MAGGCAEALGLKIPKLVDDMENTVAEAYQGHPDSLFVLGEDWKVAYSGGKGPRGFEVDEMTAALDQILTR